MYPFYDENYRSNNFMPMQHMQQMPMHYGNMYQPFQQMANVSPIKKLMGGMGMRGLGGLSLKTTLNGATKTINTINQVIPLVNQAKPVFNNARNAMRIMKAVKRVNDIDIDDLKEIDDAITIDDEIIDETDKAEVISTVHEVEETDDTTEQLFENML